MTNKPFQRRLVRTTRWFYEGHIVRTDDLITMIHASDGGKLSEVSSDWEGTTGIKRMRCLKCRQEFEFNIEIEEGNNG